MLGEKVPSGNYEDILKDGIVLCKLINKIVPGSVKKIQERGTNFQLMENVQRFQAAIKKYGLPEEEIFQTADLFERRNIPQVSLCLFSLARLVSDNLDILPNTIRLITEILISILFVLLNSDTKASRIHWTSFGTENGRQKRTNIHRGSIACA